MISETVEGTRRLSVRDALIEVGVAKRHVKTRDCEAFLGARHGDLTSGHWKDGTILICSCGVQWEHVCAEAYGCYWTTLNAEGASDAN